MLSLKTKLVSFLMPALVLALPLVSSAQNSSFDGGYFSGIVTAIENVVSSLIPVMIGLLVVVFAWGIVKYIWGGADDDKVKGKRLMIWGAIGIAVVVSISGIIGLLQDVFDVDGNTPITSPTVDTL